MIHNKCCIEGMRAMPDNSVDSIVTDPPYELTQAKRTKPAPHIEGSPFSRHRVGVNGDTKPVGGFMGHEWDGSGIAFDVEMWREALRVLKPGGHLLAFSGSRTYHRMACAIEDAGFEVRDQIMWVYGSGFPKSLDVSKAIDKAAGAVREVVGSKFGQPGYRTGPTGENEVYGAGLANGDAKCEITAPATDAAKQWQGWGTALKPAHEPICVARKPLVGTVAANVLQHGTGALNIDGCRVGDEVRYNAPAANKAGGNSLNMSAVGMPQDTEGRTVEGRWPANLIHDSSEEVLQAFPNAKGQQGATAERQQGALYGNVSQGTAGVEPRGDVGSAARFFYCAKASKSDRGDSNTHPTVKPHDLMRYLCRLVTPPGGLVLDPFTGSGSTWKAASAEGFRFIGFELSAEYCQIAALRNLPPLPKL